MNYSYDAMSRLIGASALNEPFTAGGCSSFNGSLTWAQDGAYNAARQLVGLEQVATPQASCPSTVVPYYFNQGSPIHSSNTRRRCSSTSMMSTGRTA